LRADLDRLFVFVVFSVLAFQVFIVLPIQVFSQEYLYGDGAYFFLLILSKQQVISVDWQRLFTNALVQLPLLISINIFGITSMSLLSYIYSFSLYWIPLLGLIISTLMIIRTDARYFIIPILLSYFYISLNTCLFIISECHVALSVFWVLLTVIITIKYNFTLTKSLY
jgi:hypothetical protein